MESKTVLVLGGKGQLGQCLKKMAAGADNLQLIYLDTEEGNILNMAQLERVFADYRPEWAINCAAYTAVDKAEDEPGAAREINYQGALNVAKVSTAYNCKLVHISTDFVFKGDVPELLDESATTAPISVYGLTKLEGEEAVAAQQPKHYIIRTSWLYSEFGGNFMKTMLRLGAERDELGVICDQVGTPTYGCDLAEAILGVIKADKDAYGVYHYSNEGAVSWYDFAQAIFSISGTAVKVNAIATADYYTKAVRPKWSVLDKRKIKNTFNMDVPYWRESLERCIQAYNTTL